MEFQFDLIAVVYAVKVGAIPVGGDVGVGDGGLLSDGRGAPDDAVCGVKTEPARQRWGDAVGEVAVAAGGRRQGQVGNG